jgi:uncharacterized repeat protein (TIGR03803 family)
MRRLLIEGGTLLLALPSFSAAQTYTSLFLFSGTDGQTPTAPVTVGNNVLYGTTTFGGPGGFGNVFSLTPPATRGGAWTEAVLHAFDGHDGFALFGSVVIGADGVLYGTTYLLGPSKWGTVFSLTPPASPGGSWTEATLHAFSGTQSASSDGGSPQAPVTIGGGGVLYGTTTYGGAYGAGTVFALTPPATAGGAWTEAILHSFGGAGDGTEPIAGLVIGSGKVLYGTTFNGGASGAGTVFALTPPADAGGSWTEKVLFSFSGGADGGTPYYGSLTMGSGGVLYGTTQGGGANDTGTVFSLTPPATEGGDWKQAVLYSFTYDGAKSPLGGLAIDSSGDLFGTANTGGGTEDAAGAVFRLAPPASPGGDWQYTVLHNFTFGATQGQAPYAGVVFGSRGVLFGTTSGLDPGGTPNSGTVFALTP